MTNPPAGPALPQADSPCPCGSGQTLALCCGSIIMRQRLAATAEQLMRSRFTAHVLRDYAYLHRTYLPTAGQPYVEETSSAEVAWTRLVIHSHEAGPKPDTAFVDFTAYFQDAGVERAHDEKSEFRRIEGEWFFSRAIREGPAPIKSAHPKVGRNDPCPCGSGKKYKHCCLRAA